MVVSRSRRDLFDTLRHDFAGDPVIDVIMDRRFAERPAPTAQPDRPDDPRQRERRANPSPQHDLATVGYVLMRAVEP